MTATPEEILQGIAQGIVWILSAIIIGVLLGVYLTALIVYFSVTWPWYAYRIARRLAHPH